MSQHTDIQWCDSTANPTMGCDGCELWNANRKSCYAGTLHQRHGGSNPGYSPTFEQLTFHPGRMADAAGWADLLGTRRWNKPWLDGMPRLIFVSDMSDALSKDVTYEFLEMEIVDNVSSARGRRHQWLWLTKQPARMVKFSQWLKRQGRDWPDNLWAGTSITTQGTLSRLRQLLKVGDERTIHFLSVEPQWTEIDLGQDVQQVDWVIQGGESGSIAKPFHVEWVHAIRAQCRRAKVPFFVKQFGSNVYHKNEQLKLEDSHGGDWTEWPSELRIRQVPKLPKRLKRKRDISTPAAPSSSKRQPAKKK